MLKDRLKDLLKTLKAKLLAVRMKTSPFRIIILGFAAVILVGTLLLMIPLSSAEKGGASFWDALFTATSAVCVTGLTVVNTAEYWSFFGQLIILILIQIGGLGIITVASSIAMISGRKIGLMERSTIQEAIAAPQVGGIVRMMGFILRTAFCIELVGTVLLIYPFCSDPNIGFWKGLWFAVFHSVSAFCNAGFDLTGNSLMNYADDPLVNVVIMLLIISGGIGFLTWDDIRTNKWRIKKYRLQSKVILFVSLCLILLPAIFFFFYEFSELPLKERVFVSLFQSVTTRTAGFNTTDLTALQEPSLALIIVLSLIGGSPGSTAGGIKTTTAAVLVSGAVSVFRRKDSVQMFRRRIAEGAEKSASTIFLLYVTLFFAGGMIISCIEGVPMMDALFETASAIGTMGLSLGLTPELANPFSRIILIILMFFGRVGGLTLIFAALSAKTNPSASSKYPQEKIMVG